jgi:CBS domain-containing membrane protein
VSVRLRSFLASFVPHATPTSLKERLRSPIGALLGILLTGLVSRAAVGSGSALPILIAPMGASAVLLFAVPASPLAQPWSIVGGNLVAALIGVSVALLIASPFWAAAVAIGLAIAAMMALRCLHPPSGAVALTAVLGGPAIRDLGYGFVLWPVGANSLLLLAVALLFNNLVGRSYPHRPHAAPEPAATVPPRLGFSAADLDAALAAYGELLDVDRGDLESVLHDAETRAYRRRAAETTCAGIMVRDVVAIGAGVPPGEARDRLRAHRFKALPVIDAGRKVIGIVTQTDLLERGDGVSVGAIMTAPVESLTPDMPLAAMARALGRTGHHHWPVVDGDGRLVGMVTQSDLLAALLAEDAPVRPL